MRPINPKLLLLFLTLTVIGLGGINLWKNNNIKAQEFICDPPNNYSGCPVAQTGPKIAANIQVENYKTIREEYNQTGYENQQVPVTIIYTPTDLDNEHINQTIQNLQAMKDNGLIPTVRIYGGYNFDEAEENGQNLNKAFQAVKFSQTPIVYGYNEPNLKEEGFHQDPTIYAKQMALLAKGAGDNRSFQLFLSPMAGHQGGAEQQFAIEALNFTTDDGRKLYELLDGAALTIYQDSPEKFQSEFNKWGDLFKQYGMNNFMISELGPYVGSGAGLPGHLLQNRAEMDEWKQRMTQTFQEIVNKGLLKDAKVINTSFFLDTDGDGFPDITLLVVIDKDGNVTIEEQALLIGGGFGWDKFPKIQTTCNVNGKKPDKGDLRPAPCEKCSLTVPDPTSSCAEQPNIVKKTTYACGELSQNPDEGCGEDYVTTKNWNFSFKINTENTKVPFAGYRDIEIRNDKNGRSPNMNNYLADYFEGIAFYDGQEYNFTKKVGEKIKADMETRWLWNMGVFRRLAPQEIQDDLKINLIKSNVNYEVTDGKTTLHMQNWNAKPFAYPTGYFPPDKKQYLNNQDHISQQYFIDYSDWQKTQWGKFWPYVPMFTREDAPGKIILTIEHKPGEITPTGNGKSNGTYSVEYPLSIPHLARLYQVTKEIHSLLMPSIEDSKQRFAPTPATEIKPQTCDTQLGNGMQTALGCIPTSILGFVGWTYKLSISIGGGVFIILLIIGAIKLTGSNGNPEIVKSAKQLISAAIIGLLFIVFSSFIYSLIARKILKIPGFEARQNQRVQISDNNSSSSNKLSKNIQSLTLASANIISDVQNKKVLAQNNSGDQFIFNSNPQINPDGTYKIHFSANQFVGDVQASIIINGQEYLIATPHNVGPEMDQEYGSPGSGAWYESPGVPPKIGPNDNVQFVVHFNGPLPDGYTSNSFAIACNNQSVDGSIQSDCKGDVPFTPIPAAPLCKNYSNINNICVGDNPLTDPNLNDQTCCSSISNVKVPEYKIVVSKEDYQNKCINPLTIRETTMQRKIEVRLEIPYLEEIYKNTIDGTDGFLNIFRPADWQVFPNDDALSGITYEITNGGVGIDNPKNKTKTAELYFPYLGGIQRSKKCISEIMLLPKELQNGYDWCNFSKNFTNPEKGNLTHTKFDPKFTQGCREIDQSMENFFNSVNIFDPTIKINDLAIGPIIDNFKKNSRLSVDISKSQLVEQYNTIKETSIAAGWNPLIPLSFWIEESAMGMHPDAKALMGCLDGNDQKNIDTQLQCVLNRSYTDQGFKNFMLTYAEGGGNEFCKNPNFPTNIQFYYQKLLAN